jgi:protein dithiol oxidoreductase (disulfide-forming)
MRIAAVLFRCALPVLLAAGLGAAQAMPVLGRDYVPISPAQPTESGSKIEVVEVFSYACPHCADFEPKLEPWLKSLPADVAFRRMPVTFGRDSWANLAKAYFSLEVLGQTPLSSKVFEAIHTQNIRLDDPDTLFDWAAKQGLDRKAFADVFASFGTQAKLQRSSQLVRAYGVDGVPALIIDGKYRVIAGEDMLRVADELIQLARTQRPKASVEQRGVKTAGR